MAAPRKKKGVAAVKKTNKNAKKYMYVNSDNEEVSPPPAAGDAPASAANVDVKTIPRRTRQARSGSTDISAPPTPQQQHYRDPDVRQDHPRQESGSTADNATTTAKEPAFAQQSNTLLLPDRTLERTLFADFHAPPLTAEDHDRHRNHALELTSTVPTRPSHFHRTGKPLLQHPSEHEEDYEQKFDMSGAYIPPNQQRHMRACMVCSIVRTEQQFRSQGCPNCDAFLELAGNADQVLECTSSVFDGLMSISDTSKSWVARAQRLEGYVPGVYAVQVEGVLSEDALAAIENAGVHYIPRDGSVNEALPTEN